MKQCWPKDKFFSFFTATHLAYRQIIIIILDVALFPVLKLHFIKNSLVNWFGLTWYGSLVKDFSLEDASLVDTSFDKESHRHYVVIFMVFIHLEMNLETTFDLLCFWRRMNSGSWQNARVQNSTCKKRYCLLIKSLQWVYTFLCGSLSCLYLIKIWRKPCCKPTKEDSSCTEVSGYSSLWKNL